jgi:hypothetical protein
MNSLVKEWGRCAFSWIFYSGFGLFNVKAYGLYPMGIANKKKVTNFNGYFGLELNSGKKSIAVIKTQENTFESAMILSSIDKFKVEFTNISACYTYLFGEKKHLSSCVLFTYTSKYLPFFGITDTSSFPRDYSRVSDIIGNRDRIAIGVSFQTLDYDVLSKKINELKVYSYE